MIELKEQKKKDFFFSYNLISNINVSNFSLENKNQIHLIYTKGSVTHNLEKNTSRNKEEE